MFKIGDGDLAPSSTRPDSSSASDASGRGVVCPSQASSVHIEPPTKLAPLTSSSDRAGTGGRSGVAAPGPPAPVPAPAPAEAGEAAVAQAGSSRPKRRNHPWVLTPNIDNSSN